MTATTLSLPGRGEVCQHVTTAQGSAHQLGLTYIQRRDPLHDLLIIRCYVHHVPPAHSRSGDRPQEPQRDSEI